MSTQTHEGWTSEEVDQPVAAVSSRTKYREMNDPDTIELFMSMSHQIRIMADQLARCEWKNDAEDFFQIGMFEAATEACYYDANSGIRFETFAFRRVRGAIVDHMRRTHFFKRKAIEEYKVELQKNSEGAILPRRRRLYSMTDIDFGESGFDIACEREQDEDQMATAAFGDRYFKCLTKTAIQMLNKYYVDGMSMSEIGAEMGVGESRVSQMFNSIKRTIKKKGMPDWWRNQSEKQGCVNKQTRIRRMVCA